MNRTRIVWIELIVGLSVILSACAPTAPADTLSPAPTQATATSEPSPTETVMKAAPIEVEDALGQKLIFQNPPQRIVQAGRAGLMIVDAIYAFPEAQQNMVALSEITQGLGNFGEVIDPFFAQKTLVSRDTGAEPILAMNPDVVIMKSMLAKDFGKQIQDLGVPVIYLDLETPEQFQRDLTTLGQLFNNPQRAEELKQYYQQKSEWVTSQTETLSEEQKPRVLLLYYSSQDGQTALSVPPLTWLQTTLVENAGGIPVWQDLELGGGWTKVNFEQIAAWDADQIYIIAYNDNVAEVTAGLEEDTQWQALRAVQQGQLFGFPGDYYSWDQPDTRWILGQMWLASKTQPEVFADLDIKEEAAMFFQTLYGMDESAFAEKIIPILSGDVD
ncbi:ABC transporter substrate-binding protein [Ornatilinea apprima]|uniref:ABC transporter substrate-binding protein n=1 Tax=Ornatilinea apprima TaxID=1134406 RepID=UPI0009EBB654|nr:ABC transporter substrate-binding protein [Ornatilinea apprima]